MQEARRERRIRDKRRMKAKAAKIYPNDPRRRNADHLAACSCHMCRNPRRNFFLGAVDRLTMQERKQGEADRLRMNTPGVSPN